MDNKEVVICSFCGKNKQDTDVLIWVFQHIFAIDVLNKPMKF